MEFLCESSFPRHSNRWWEDILRGILSGELPLELRNQGGIESYVRSEFIKSESRQDSETAFRSAFQDLVISWDPHEGMYVVEAAYMVELINAFRPPNCHGKLLQLLSLPYESFEEVVESIPGGYPIEVRPQALSAIRKYFPAAPIRDDYQSLEEHHLYVASFQHYVVGTKFARPSAEG